MDELVRGYEAAGRRADDVRAKIEALTRAGMPVTPDVVTELARLEDDALAKLLALQRAGFSPAAFCSRIGEEN